MVTLSAPSSLASFTASRASSSKSPHVALSPVQGSSGKLGVATVPGDGVWTYDLVALRPVSTYTVSPSTRFSGAAISYIQPASAVELSSSNGKGKGKGRQAEEDDAEGVMEVDGEDVELSSSVDSEEQAEPEGPVRRTMVAVQSKGDTSEVWVWDGEEGGEKTVIHLDQITQSLQYIPNAPYPAIAIHSPTSLTLFGPRNTVHPISTASPFTSTPLIASRVVPFDAASSGLITLSESGQVTSLRIEHPEDGVPSVRVTAEAQIPLSNDGEKQTQVQAQTPKKGKGKAASVGGIVSADIRPDGTVAAVLASGEVVMYDTRTSKVISQSTLVSPPSGGAITLLPTAKPVCLHSTAKSASASGAATTIEPASLLATLSSTSPAVLGATDISAILPTPDSTVVYLSILAIKGDVYTIGLVAWHPAHSSTPAAATANGGSGADGTGAKDGNKGGRSIVHLVEVSAPSKSIGMNALIGSAATTAKYILPTSTSTSPASAAKLSKADINPASFSSTSPSPLTALLTAPTRSPTDWSAILTLLRAPSALSIPSAELVRALKLSLAEEHLEEVYDAILDLPPPDLAYRVELRRQLGANEAGVILGDLVRRLEMWEGKDEGVKWDVQEEVQTKSTLPSLLSHTSSHLDALLPILIDHTPSHPLLVTLSTLLSPMLAQQATLSQLRAPIDALLTLAKREEKRRAHIREKRAAFRGVQEQQQGQQGFVQTKTKMAEMERTRVNRGAGQGGRMGLGGDVGLWSVEDFDF